MAFPGALPSFAGFTSSHTLAADNHAAQHNLEQGEIVALATKVGTGASTPSASTVLRGTGAGTSAFGQVVLTTDVSGQLPISSGGTGQSNLSGLTLPSAILANPSISGTVGGSATYTSPTLTTPTIASFVNAVHDHESNAGGGTLDASLALQAGTITHDLLGEDSSWAWQSWTPTLRGAVTDPTLGSGSSALGVYAQIGKTIVFKFKILFGSSGVSGGSGQYYLQLPFPAKNDFFLTDSAGPMPGWVRFFDNDTSATYMGGMEYDNTNVQSTGAGACTQLTWWNTDATSASTTQRLSVSGVTNTSPFTFAANDRMLGSFTYEME